MKNIEVKNEDKLLANTERPISATRIACFVQKWSVGVEYRNTGHNCLERN